MNGNVLLLVLTDMSAVCPLRWARGSKGHLSGHNSGTIAAVEVRGSVNVIDPADFFGCEAGMFLHLFSVSDLDTFAFDVIVVHCDVNRFRQRRNSCVDGILSGGGRGRHRGVGSGHR